MKRSGQIFFGIAALLGAVLVLIACAPAPEPTTQTITSAPVEEEDVPTMTVEEATAQLFAAAIANDVDAATEALKNDAQLEARDGDGRTPLVAATKTNSAAVAKALLEAGADPNAKDNLQDSAYLYAGAEGLDEILVETLKHGADVTSTNRYGGTALIPASEHGHVSTVKLLIDAGVPVNHINNLHWTALHEAIVLGTGSPAHIETVRLLIEGGADVTIADGNGVSPRDLAASRGYREIVALIDAAS